ncbi:MAG TPA: hypothetical protein VJQ52_07375 [Steroidobacteraceae bacterium]|nr:hypothetical protein [Steroidobacteraceae bacterium]
MKKGTLTAAVLLGLCTLSASAKPGKLDALTLSRTVGGRLDDLVVSGTYSYVATGRVVVTWSHAEPSAPVQVSAVEQPASGLLTGLVQVGDYLYASWQTAYGTSGVAVYSLADPARPALVNDVQLDSQNSSIRSIGVVNGSLVLVDVQRGLFVGSLNNPRKPRFKNFEVAPGVEYERTFTDGNRVVLFGKNFTFGTVLTVVDMSDPRSPLALPSFGGIGVDFFDARYQSPFAVTFGMKLSLLDLSQGEPVLRGSVSGPPATTGIVDGEWAYGLGFDGLDVWNIADPDNPLHLQHLAMDTLAADATANVKGGALMLTRTDRFVYLDTSNPKTPKEVGSALLNGSVDAYDAAAVGDTVLLLQQNYGLAVADPKTLKVISRYEFDLPPALQARAFNDMHVEGNLAYLAAWGYGLVIADVSNPQAPVEVSREEFPSAHTVSVEKNRAYVAKNTDGPMFGIIDISDPADPSLLSARPLPYSPAQVDARDDLLYITGYPNVPGDFVGLRILDVSDPSAPVEIAHYNDNCASAFGVAFAPGSELIYLACSNGLHIVDASSPKQPVRVAYVPTPDLADTRINIEARGNRVWYGSGAGVYEIDVTHPKAPKIVGHVELGGYGPVNLRAIGPNRILGLTGTAGIHVMESRAGR